MYINPSLFVRCILNVSTILILISCTSEGETTQPRYMYLTESVYASGSMKAKNQYQVYSTVSGILEHIYVEEGDRVTRGQTLFRIQSENTELSTANARLNLELARQNYGPGSPILQEIVLNVESAYQKYVKDSLNYYRKKRLWEEEIGTLAEVEQFQLILKTSRNSYFSARERLASTRSQLKNELERAENTYRMQVNNRGDFSINSKIDGKVYAINKEEGELVMQQEPLAVIGDADQFLLELQVDELDIGRIRRNNKVLVTLDTYGDAVFEAYISKIYPLLDKRTQTFLVEAELKERPAVLYPALSLEANIIVRDKEKALAIPKVYLVDNEYVLDQSGEKISVTVGVNNLEYVEIQGDIDTTTVLVKP